MTYREICLREAMRVVCQSREQEYGSPEDSFQQIRELWEAYLGLTLAPHDVAMMMALLKIARIKSGHFKEDSFIDAVGYVACGYEIARMENEGKFAGVSKDKDKAASETGERRDNEARGENVTRGDNEERGESVTQVDNDTPPDTDTRTDTNTRTETDLQTETKFQFGVRDGETKTTEEREAEVQSCVAYGLRESQKEMRSPVFRDAQKGIGAGFAYASPNGPGMPCEYP